MSSVEQARAERPPEALSPSGAAIKSRAFEVVETPADVEALWRSFEDEAVCSPYQRFDWVQSYTAALGLQDGFRVRVLVLRDDGGGPLLVLPLAVRRQHGLAVASFVGGKQANFNLPIAAAGLSATLGVAELRALLLRAGRDLGADAFIFLNQPLSWRGEPNPLALFGGRPSANQGYKLTLAADGDATLARILSGETRKKMRKKERFLGELGEVKFWAAREPGDVDTILDAFFEQKQRRFRNLGIANPFDDATRRFITLGSLAGLDQGRPAIELYALSAGEHMVATFGGAGDRWRLCGMFNSFDNSERFTRSSPGELLLAHLIRRQCEAGRQVFDLGVGQAPYKTAVCNEIEELIDVFVPVTGRGRFYAMAVERLVAAKRLVKETPWAWRAAGALRALKTRVSR